MAEHLKQIRHLCKIIFDRFGPAKQGMWRGHRALKYPTDLMLYSEMIFENKPDFIIETGLRYGGSALFYADVCRLANHGKVICVEIDEKYEAPKHTRLQVIYGDSVSEDVMTQIKKIVTGKRVMVILDSDHSLQHIYAELCAYAPLLSVGDYIVAEDLYAADGEVAVHKFLQNNPNFKRDKKIEKYGIHCAAGGFIKRVS